MSQLKQQTSDPRPRRVAIVSAPSSAAAYAPGQEQAPAALRAAGLLRRLEAAGLSVREAGEGPFFRWQPDPGDPRAQNRARARDSILRAAAASRKALRNGDFVLLLGGDCTHHLGLLSAVVEVAGGAGSIYLDLHGDLNTPQSTVDGSLDWMGLAHALALPGTTKELREIGPRSPLIEPSDLCLLGLLESDATEWERARIREDGIGFVPRSRLQADPQGAARQAIARVNHERHLVVHFDVDAVDFNDAPLSEHPGRGKGVTLDAALQALGVLLRDSRVRGLSIGELNPDHGAADGSTLARLVEGLGEALGGILTHERIEGFERVERSEGLERPDVTEGPRRTARLET